MQEAQAASRRAAALAQVFESAAVAAVRHALAAAVVAEEPLDVVAEAAELPDVAVAAAVQERPSAEERAQLSVEGWARPARSRMTKASETFRRAR